MKPDTRARRIAEIEHALAQTHGNQAQAARLLGISRETLSKYARVLRDGAALVTVGAPTIQDRYMAQHVCRTFVPECARCQMERALFLLSRARVDVKDPVLRHEIEEALWRWPTPVLSPVPVMDPVDRVEVPAPAAPDQPLGSERKEEETFEVC